MLIERSQRMLHVEMSTESAMCGGITGRVSVGGIPLGVGMVAIGISFLRVKERSYFILISVSLWFVWIIYGLHQKYFVYVCFSLQIFSYIHSSCCIFRHRSVSPYVLAPPRTSLILTSHVFSCLHLFSFSLSLSWFICSSHMCNSHNSHNHTKILR